jgi:DNA-binding LacI/PurR family transcriptional regulator
MNLVIQKNGNESIYLQIKEQLKEYIAANKLKEGDRLPDIKSIAHAADVSLRTAYLGVEELLKEGVCYKRPKNGIFVRHQQHKYSLRNICGIYDKRHLDSYNYDSDLVQQAIFKGISANSDTHHTETFFITHNPVGTIDFYSKIKELNLTGVFMLYWNDLEEGIELAKRFPQVKFVYINYFIKGFEQTPENIYGVFNDDFAGAYQMCSNVLDGGCKQIKVFTFDLPDENYKRRVDGFLAKLEEAGYDLKSDIVMNGGAREKRSLQEIGRTLAEKLFTAEPGTDAILCVNDLMAEGVSDWLKEQELDDVRVTGYDNILRHVSANKSFSTVSLDFNKMANTALDIISGKTKNCPKIINIPPQILERKNKR